MDPNVARPKYPAAARCLPCIRVPAVSVDFFFTLANATADAADYVCPTADHALINPDTLACEPGFLAGGKSTSAAILVTPTITSGTVTVTACANDEDGLPDPNPSNKTVSIRIQ